MKQQKVLIAGNSRDFLQKVQESLKEGWLIAPQSLNASMGRTGGIICACVVEKELRETNYTGPK